MGPPKKVSKGYRSYDPVPGHSGQIALDNYSFHCSYRDVVIGNQKAEVDLMKGVELQCKKSLVVLTTLLLSMIILWSSRSMRSFLIRKWSGLKVALNFYSKEEMTFILSDVKEIQLPCFWVMVFPKSSCESGTGKSAFNQWKTKRFSRKISTSTDVADLDPRIGKLNDFNLDSFSMPLSFQEQVG
ncbi:hypothetical protein DITRI_Ditri18aG0021900 [Diplodiscus trichospermus]